MKKKQTSKTNGKHKAPTKLKLHPVEFEDALAAFLNTPPPEKPTKKSEATKKRAAKKRQG